MTPTALTPNEQAAHELAIKGMSQRAIALQLGISRSAVRARLENAQRKIRAAEDNERVIIKGVDVTDHIAKRPGKEQAA